MSRALRCIVTGGSSGIGEAVCQELGRRGHQVFPLASIVPAIHVYLRSVHLYGYIQR
jgi:NAD(P)-dependent dehydrogenase (short-subunit alcohol dehydrogenase family)